ncbi:MAG TPA: hypothetical protein VGR13_09095, partial [Actinomycetota bacterium]|nr:hypothetical protein [Actinomycetota bacterium]
VARESASDVRAKKPDIARDLESRTDGVADRYTEYARTVDRQLAEAAFLLAPSLRKAGSDTQRELSNVLDGTLRAIDERLSVEKNILTRSERAAVNQLRQASSEAEAELRRGSRQATQEVDVAAGALVAEIDRGVEEAATVVGQEEAPFIPGVREILRSSLRSIENTATRGRAQLRGAVDSPFLAAIVASLTSTTDQLVAAAAQTAEGAKGRFRSAATRSVRDWREQSAGMVTALATTQNQQVTSVLAEIDRAAEKARGEMIRMTGDFSGDVRRAADQSIGEARKPREGLEGRAQQAAEDMDQPWYVGLGRALVQIAIGLVILIAVALVVAAIAAAFGVILAAWTAVMIAGAILLTIGLIVALVQRARQPELQGRPGMVILMALSDTVGVTGIIEGIRGRELFTDRPLSDAAATERGVLGVVTLVSLFFGARAAIKGPPGGIYTRPSTLRPGWVGFGEFMPRAWQGIRSVGVEMWQGMQAGYRSVREWMRTRTGRGPSPESARRAGEPSEVLTNRPEERPYHHPPGRQVIGRENPLRLQDLDPNQRYLWVVDENGNWVFAPEGTRFDPATGRYVRDPTQAGFGRNEVYPEGRVVKHGDLVPGPEGQSRGVARQGGELFAERDANGNLTGRWVMNNDSSYTFARTDGTTLGPRELEGAFELLGQTGTDTNSIVLRQTGNPEAGPAVTPSRGPMVPRPVTTGQGEENR